MSNLNPDSGRRFFLKQLAIGAGISLISPGELFALQNWAITLPRSSPESQGIASQDILRFVETAEKSKAGLHSLMVIRHGHVVAEGWWHPYTADQSHWLYSLSKNFTATAIGMAIDEGILHLNDRVIDFFPATDLPETISENLSLLTIRDLLTMSGGHAADTYFKIQTVADGNWAKAFFAIPLDYKPGTRFVYDSGTSYMLSAILHRKTGSPMLDFLQPRLFSPLGIKDAQWDTDPRGINVGAAGLRLTTEDIARFSQLYLQNGKWKGKRILSEEWIREATSFKIRNDQTGTPTKTEEDDIKQGYGYHFWMSRPAGRGAYRSEGAFCQYSIVMPEQDAVIAFNAEGISTKRVMDLTWGILLPAMKKGRLEKNPNAHAQLQYKLQNLVLPVPAYASNSPRQDQISGKMFIMDTNPMNFKSAVFNFDPEGCQVTFTIESTEYTINCGSGKWISGKTSIPGSPPNVFPKIPLYQSEWKVAASGTWTDENTYTMTWLFYETPHADIVTCRFTDTELTIIFNNSVNRIIKQFKDPRGEVFGRIKN